MKFIGVDLGTSFIKGAVLDLDGLSCTHTTRVPTPEALTGLPPLQHEVAPLAILGAVRSMLDGLLALVPDCAGLVMCGQMHGLVLCDRRGNPLSNAITWLDQRALGPHPSGKGTYYERVRERASSAEIRRMGSELRPGLPVCALFTLLEAGQLPSEEAMVTSVPDFVLANLCRTTPLVEPTHVSAFGGLNLETLDWDTPFINRLGLGRLRFPPVRPVGSVVGYYESGGRKIPCYVSVGDQQAALTGALLEEGELSINASTGAQVTLISPGLEYGDHQVRPYFDGRFFKIITHIPAGRSLTALASLLSEVARAGQPRVDAWDYLTRAAEQVAETDLRVDLSFYASTTGMSGSIRNIREDNLSAGHLFRAAYENIAENFYIQALRLSPGREWRRLVFSGGLVQKIPLLHRLIVERFGSPGGQAPRGRGLAPSRMSPTPEDSLTGLLALALVCSGEAGSVSAAVARLARAYAQMPGQGAQG